MRERFGEAWDLLFHPPVAHRGLWSAGGPPENSLAAFEAAWAAGYGIELDVQLTRDGEAVVFHDWKLDRLTGAKGALAERTAAELSDLRLSGGSEKIPTLSRALEVIAGRAMVHIELKTPAGHEGGLEQRVADLVAAYRGPFALIGFNPHSHAWLADRRPEILRGLDSYSYSDAVMPDAQRRAWSELEHVAIARPHFLALGLDMLPSEAANRHRAAGLPIVAWTVRSPDQWETVRDNCDNLIFEGFRA